MSANKTGNPTEALAPASAPSLTDYPIQNVPSDGDALAAASVLQAMEVNSDYIAFLLDRFRDLIYGDGSDGSLSSPGSLTLAGPKFYDTIDLSAAINLHTTGWPIICRTKFKMNNASARVTGTPSNASLATSAKYAGGFFDAGPHGCLTPSNGLGSGSYSYVGQKIYGLGGSGGTGGGSSPTGTTVVDPGTAYKKYPYNLTANIGPVGMQLAGSDGIFVGGWLGPIKGGGAGSPGGVAASSTGGGGGGGGALIVIIAPTIELLAGTMDSNGSNGGAGAGTTGHGGGGGGGGAFLFICKNYTNSGVTFSATGGGGGLGVGAGSPGNSGTAGNTTPIIVTGP